MELFNTKTLTQELAEAELPCARALLEDTETLRALEALSGHQPDLCRRACSLCAPWLPADRDADEWLRELYDRLSCRIFPEGERPELTEGERLYLLVLEALFSQNVEEFDPLTDLLTLETQQEKDSNVAAEYARFRLAVREAHLMALLRLGRELQPFDPASHTIGVHNVAVHTALFAKQAGFPVDLPLISAAALGHDIGKFGCRGSDAARVPYLHYYYTWQWFCENDMENIGHVSANHSTWDLEFENLPIESLLLIYADFRVRGKRTDDGREEMKICSLKEAGEVIFSKLYNMTPEKQLRYRTVYTKLQDFEQMLVSSGVPTQIDVNALTPVTRTDASLLSPEQALRELRTMTLRGSVALMRTISTDKSLEQLLEQAKGEKNLQRIRTYLLLLEEFSTYMTRANKQKTLLLLYELLMHPDGDVRRTAGRIMGQILANSGPKYRKERPQSAKSDTMTPTMMTLLSESVELWQYYIDQCLYPERKISPKHAIRISNSLKIICEHLFASCDEKEAPRLLEPLFDRAMKAQGFDRFALIDSICHVPSRYLREEQCLALIGRLTEFLGSEKVELRVISLRCLQHLQQLPRLRPVIERVLLDYNPPEDEYRAMFRYLKGLLLGQPFVPLTRQQVSQIHLSNLKNVVHWTVKLEQMEMLCRQVREQPQSAFHTAMHLSNLMSVSEHLPVREAAGRHLLEIAPELSVDQINEITIDLTRELETGQEQVSLFIAPYLGRLMCLLPEKELQETVGQLEELARGASALPAQVAMRTLGEAVAALPEDRSDVLEHILGILMTGISHYKPAIHQTALNVLCLGVLGNSRIPMERRHDIFVGLHKKLLTILSEPHKGNLIFFNRAAMLNHLYRFIVEQETEHGPFRFAPTKPVAFFPGTFDPFSVGHKQIVEEIRARGFEVYLAVDEFSWRKKTLPKLLRRKIVGISIADQPDTYLFPDDIPINIAMPQDLALLKRLLPRRELYLVAGSDVIANASAYRQTGLGSAATYNHIIFCRDGSSSPEELSAVLRGKVQLLSLPPFYETVSSTRIRESIDQKLDISMLVDPVVQNLIYEQGLYVRSPEEKSILEPQSLLFRRFKSPSPEAPEDLNHLLHSLKQPLGVALYARPDQLKGWAVGRTILLDDLYGVLGSLIAATYVRRHASGQLLWIDRIRTTGEAAEEETVRMLLNELLARSLEKGPTYALCRCPEENTALRSAISQLGFVPAGNEDIFYVDMRAPVMLLQDVMLCIKKPHHDDPAVQQAVMQSRPKLRRALNQMFPGKLLLCFDSEMLNQALLERIEKMNGVRDVPKGERTLGPYMCVPYGKIFSDEIVPNTVTKTLHVEKCFHPNLRSFEIQEYPGYSQLKNQVRTLKSFQRPILLVDDLLHKGYRIDKLDKVFRSEQLTIRRIIVAVMSGYGRDLMRVQGRQAECEYFIPNLRYWLTESLLYPFIGGDSIVERPAQEHMLPSVNLILPYCYPYFFRDASQESVRVLSKTALEGALQILRALERAHQCLFSTALTIRRLSEALQHPRLPDKGSCMNFDFSRPASDYLEEDLAQIDRICQTEVPRK
ncbi:MAG: hypothetical protein ACI3VQ_05265 [Faecousia sp.]